MRTRRMIRELAYVAARSFTPKELCEYANEGQGRYAHIYMEALSIQAETLTWGEIIRQTMTDCGEEEDDGVV